MNSEQLVRAFQAFVNADNDEFMKLGWEVVEEEERKNHHLLAKRLRAVLEGKAIPSDKGYPAPPRSQPPIPRDNEKGFHLLEINSYYLGWDDVILSVDTSGILRQIVEEVKLKELFATYGLKPKQKILFLGAPGTGKTLSAKVISSVLGHKLIYIRFEAVISSYLGETASNLKKIFDYIEKGTWVVLFDEFDIIGKQRDDPSEHGEIKRVVNNFMLMLENYVGDSIIVAATNHPHLLDIGIWRRFDETVYFDLPDEERRSRLFSYYLKVIKKDRDIDTNELAKLCKGFSGADIEQVCIEAIKLSLLKGVNLLGLETIEESIEKQKIRQRNRRVLEYE